MAWSFVQAKAWRSPPQRRSSLATSCGVKKNGRTQSADRGQSVKSHCLMMTVRLIGLFVPVSLFTWTISVKLMVQV